MTIVLKAEKRDVVGKGASRRLRHAEKLPAVIYGPGKEAISIVLDEKTTYHAQEKAEFFEGLVIELDGQEIKVKPQDIQRHAFKPKLVHVDFKFA